MPIDTNDYHLVKNENKENLIHTPIPPVPYAARSRTCSFYDFLKMQPVRYPLLEAIGYGNLVVRLKE